MEGVICVVGFWIISGKCFMFLVLRNGVLCKKLWCKEVIWKMVDILKDRFELNFFFINVGVDVFGLW